jgi:hypothetical protein
MTPNPVTLHQPEIEGANGLPSHDFSCLSILQFLPMALPPSVTAAVLNSATPAVGKTKILSIKRHISAVGRASLAGFCVLSLLLMGRPSQAATFTEIADAGNLPATAQITSAAGLLTEIHGNLSPADGDGQDMYLIHIDGGGTFSATTLGGASFDTELFLFYANGKGVYANDDASGDFAPSKLPDNHVLTPITAGDYYLAITQCCSVPVSNDGQIFTIAGPNHRALSGPTGPGGALPITGYSGGFVQTPGGGSYQIFLTGAHASVVQASVVPEPGAFALMLAGLGMMGLLAGHRNKIDKTR